VKVPAIATASPDVVRAMPLEMFFDYLGVRLNGDKAANKSTVLNWRFTDTKQDLVVRLHNSALTTSMDTQAADADATVTLTRATLDDITMQKLTFPQALQTGRIAVTGQQAKLVELLGMLDSFPAMFPIVEPRPQP
jgi:alkyl sulfatase BDS1-like metallo-beta-lactamase superfamily hydrolase